MKCISSWIRWFFVIAFVFGGFSLLVSGSVISGICLAAIGFLISPFSSKFFGRQFQKELPVWGKIVLGILLFFGYAFTVTPPKASETALTPAPIIEQQKAIPDPTSAPVVAPEEVAGAVVNATGSATSTASPSPIPSPMPTTTPQPTASQFGGQASPTPTVKPTVKPTPKPTAKPTVRPVIAQPATSGWVCNCAKTCPQMSSCGEAQFQLNNCGCRARDADHDGVACDTDCQ